MEKCNDQEGYVRGLGSCDSCQEECQSAMRCERYKKGVSIDGEV